MSAGTLRRLAAFSDQPTGGNPAGVWVGNELPAPEEMQQIAAEVGYSETAFVAPESGRERIIRYYSPESEIPFCGHATIATGAVIGGETDAMFVLSTSVGDVPISTRKIDGQVQISLTSVDTRQKPISEDRLAQYLDALDWNFADLDNELPPAFAFAGAWHLILATKDADRHDNLDYDFDVLKQLMLEDTLITVQIVRRESDSVFHARNPFPVGGVIEDPATGAAAAALGGYLRDTGILAAPATFRIRQGEVMGRPSRLTVEVPVAGGITVSGTAVDID